MCKTNTIEHREQIESIMYYRLSLRIPTVILQWNENYTQRREDETNAHQSGFFL